MFSFNAKIEIIGVNPYVPVPKKVLLQIFKQANKDKGPIPIKGKMNGVDFIQTLVKYSGQWRLYLNTPMRKSTQTGVGDRVTMEIEYDPQKREIPMHEKLKKALQKDKIAHSIYKTLRPSLQLEIVRYIHNLKTEESIDKNVVKAIQFLHGNQRFIGRDKPE